MGMQETDRRGEREAQDNEFTAFGEAPVVDSTEGGTQDNALPALATDYTYMQTKSILSARDFVYVYEPGIGQTYQNCSYLITVPRTAWPFSTYVCSYRGQRFTEAEGFLSAVDACAKFEEQRQAQSARPALKLAKIGCYGRTVVAYDCETDQEIFQMQIPAHGKQGVMPERFRARLVKLGYDADRNVYTDTIGQLKIWIGNPQEAK